MSWVMLCHTTIYLLTVWGTIYGTGIHCQVLSLRLDLYIISTFSYDTRCFNILIHSFMVIVIYTLYIYIAHVV